MDKKTPWEVLSQINVNDHIEKKNGLTYLSWAWAWGQLKNHYPEATYQYHWFESDGCKLPYCIDSSGNAYVVVSVTVDGYELQEILPVLNFNNKPLQNPNSFDVNKAHKRCLTKAIALHGLGHYIYAGEDLPENTDDDDTDLDDMDLPEDTTQENIYEDIKVEIIERLSQMFDGGEQEAVQHIRGLSKKEASECFKEVKNLWKENISILNEMKEKSAKDYEEIVEQFKPIQANLKERIK